jgi:predicted metal-dependent HD superfamily phosphohydrolase
LLQAKDHEKLSCELVREYLPQFGYTTEAIERICSMIMATSLPQQPKNKLEEILCDADLDYLGRDDFYTTGAKLYQEFIARDVVKNEAEWNKVQLHFLENHSYFTNTATKLRKQKKDAHLHEIRTKVQSGT